MIVLSMKMIISSNPLAKNAQIRPVRPEESDRKTLGQRRSDRPIEQPFVAAIKYQSKRAVLQEALAEL
jgi:hypothetical protein